MPRPISWLPRLHEIVRSISKSTRSHYDRRDLEKLFELQPRAAQKMLEMLPTVQVGTSHLVDREILANFLERVRKADNVPELYVQVWSEKRQTLKQKPRTLFPRDVQPLLLDAAPANIHFDVGRVTVTFQTIEELATAMYNLARVLDTDAEQIARRYEVR